MPSDPGSVTAIAAAESPRSEDSGAVASSIEALPRIDPSPVAIRIIAALALTYTAYFAAPVLIPITLAVILSLTLSPLVDQLVRWYIPRGLAAAMLVLASIASVIFLIYALAEPAAAWAEKAPSSFQEIEQKLRPIKQPIQQLRAVEDKLNALTDTDQADKESAPAPAPTPARVHLVEVLFSGTPDTLFSIGATIILLFFLLSQRDTLLRKVATLLPEFSDKKLAVSVVRDIQLQISTYLATIALINLGLGLITTGMLALFGFPNPALWGAMAAIMNFVPYLGALFNISVLLVVSLLTFDTLSGILLPPLLFAILTTLEGQVITPMILGSRLALSPVVVFTLILIMGWMWGVTGALIAIPLLASLKIFCEAIEPLQPIARLIAD